VGKGIIKLDIELDYTLAYKTQEKSFVYSKNMEATYPLRVQAIRSRGQKPRMYVSFPLALAAAIGLEPGDEVQWELLDRGELHLVRIKPGPPAAKSKSRKS
jgi:hypothetical protein